MKKSLKPCSPPRFSPTLHFFERDNLFGFSVGRIFRQQCRVPMRVKEGHDQGMTEYSGDLRVSLLEADPNQPR